MRIFGKELKFNGNDVYHKGNKPTPSEIGAYTKTQVDNLITGATGAKVYVSATQPSGTIASGSVWL